MKDLLQYIKNEYHKWGWIGQRVHDSVGINELLELNFIVSCDYGREVNHFFNNCLISLEKKGRKRLNWSNEDLNYSFEEELEEDFMKLINETDGRLNAICYRSIGKLERLTNKLSQKIKLFAVPESLKKVYDNKIYVREKVKQLGITPIPGYTIKLTPNLYNKLKSSLGTPFVIQFPYGSSGKNTYKINNEREYKHMYENNISQEVNALKYINGYCLNVNAIIVNLEEKKVFCTYPSVQLTGLKECSHYPTIFCGNDYGASADIPDGVVTKVKDIVTEVGKWMGKAGYKGIFGMDLIVNEEDEVFPIEINPRFQNSTGLFTVLEIKEKKELPLFLLHIIEFLKSQDSYLKKVNYDIPDDYFMNPVRGAQVILHNNDTDNIIQDQVLPGVYKFKDGKLNYIRPGSALTDCRRKNEFLVTSGVPFENQSIAPFAPICKIQFKHKVLSSNCKTLKPKISNIIKEFYRYINIGYNSYSKSGVF